LTIRQRFQRPTRWECRRWVTASISKSASSSQHQKTGSFHSHPQYRRKINVR